MLAIFGLALMALVGISSVEAQVESRLVDLRVDHFNPLDQRTFEARYFNNAEHWIPGGVIFIYVSGGFEVYNEFLVGGAMYDLARETNSHLFTLEHRYFGQSRPTEDTSVENLRFLTVHQALADIAQFVAFIRENYYGARNSRVILWGRGYGGSLAVWARQKYPNAVDAVWASSAPINAVLEYPRFFRNTFYTLRSIGDEPCGEIQTDAFRMIEDAIRTRNTTYVEERLNLCNPIDVDIEEDIAQLFYQISYEIGGSFVTNARYPDIDDKCRVMRGVDLSDNPIGTPADNALDAFARWFVDDFNRNLECLNYSYDSVVSRYQQTAWDTVSTIAGRRQTFWLQCTQLGQFPVANESEDHPYGWRFDINFFRQWCARAFDEQLFSGNFMEESIAATNEYFGGLNPHIYRVFFTHGEMDPRHNLGPNEDLNEKAPAVVMILQSFGRDFGSASDTDYVVLQQTKERARELMLEWIFDALEEENNPPPVEPLRRDPQPLKMA